MSTAPRALCHGCGRQHHVTTGGTFRRHRRDNGATCPGSGQPPEQAVATAAPKRAPTGPPPPTEPTYGRSCDGGHCDKPSVGWRLFRSQPDWLPVCGLCMGGPAGRTRIYDDACPHNQEER